MLLDVKHINQQWPQCLNPALCCCLSALYKQEGVEMLQLILLMHLNGHYVVIHTTMVC